MNLTWTEKEKKKLLEALQKHGLCDLQVIAKYVETKSIGECEYAIKLYEQAAIESLRENSPKDKLREAPIDKWISLMKKVSPDSYSSKDIATAFKLIAQFEDKQGSGINLSGCYDFIADLMCGRPPKKLDQETEQFLLLCIVKLSEIVNKQDNTKETNYLSNLKYEDLVSKSYGSKASVVSDPALNILKVPKELLKMKKFSN